MKRKLRQFLDRKVEEFNNPSFVEADPIVVPHGFTKRQDIEISGFFAAVFAWGNRATIISKTRQLMELMENAPHQFCLALRPAALNNLLEFKHRTFNATDLLYFLEFFHHHYHRHDSLEPAFSTWMRPEDTDVERALDGFHHYFFSLPDAPQRTGKHIASPQRNSTCKRLNMFLRWMVRRDGRGVDFGLWNTIRADQLVCPVDIHVARVGRHLGLIERRQTDWLTALELTRKLRDFDPADPAKYDFALFSMGVLNKPGK